MKKTVENTPTCEMEVWDEKAFSGLFFFLVDVVIKVEKKVLKELLLSYLSFVHKLLQLGLINTFNQLEKGD